MNTLKVALLASVAVVGFAGAAMAADPYLPPIDEPIFDAPVDNGWDGPYIGIYGGGIWNEYDASFGALGVQAGVNFALGDVLVGGVEVQVGAWGDDFDDLDFEAFALGKLGIGVSDAVLIYAEGGFGYISGPDTAAAAFGGGIEFAVTESISLEGEVLGVYLLDPEIWAARATVGLNFHF